MALIDIAQLYDKRRVLWDKFRGAVIMAASSVYAELDTVENHANRLLWAKDVLLEGSLIRRTEELYRLGMTNASIVEAGEAAQDSDVEWVVAHFLDTVARG